MISLKRRFSYASFYYLLYGGAFLVIAALAVHTIRQSMMYEDLLIQDYDGYRCLTGTTFNRPSFRILDAVYTGDILMADKLCANAVFTARYSSVEVQRGQRDNVDLRSIYELRYGLILSKPEMMARTDSSGLPGYRLVARYPDYGSQLIALDGVPQLERSYFEGRTLGLLDDPNSLSSYQIPKAVLRREGLDDNIDIIYFKTHRQLFKALFGGSVDVVASIHMKQGPDDTHKLPRGLALADALSGPGWYLHPDLYQTPLHCELAATLMSITRDSSVPYLNQLQLVEPCHD